MTTGCDLSLQPREAGAGWHQWCRGEQVGKGSRIAMRVGGALQCWERALYPALLLAASSLAVPRTSTAGNRDAVGVCRVRPGTLLLSLPTSQGPQPTNVSGPCLCFFKLQVPPGSVLHISSCGCVPLPLPTLGLGPGSIREAQCPGATSSDTVAGG